MSVALHEICRASAGSGKTHQLTSRYLRLLRGGVEPKTILATTFTRKAAGEVLGRVLGRLARAARSDAEREKLSADIHARLTHADCTDMLRALVGSMHELAIGTLDSFFNRVAQCFTFELSLPPEPTLIDERSAAAAQLRLEAIEAMLGDDDLATLLELLRRMHHDTAARSVTEVIDQCIRDDHGVYREAPDQALWSMLDVPSGLDDEWLRGAIGRLTDTTWRFPDKRWGAAFSKFVEKIHLSDWESIVTGGLGRAWLVGSYYKKPFPEDLSEAAGPIVEHAVAQVHAELARRTGAYHHVLSKFDRHYDALRRRQAVMLFSDVTHALAHGLATLGDGVMLDVYYRLDGRVRHLMLDEFQDTSLDQWAILEPIAQEVAGDMSQQRSFYCVGDVKQAIYGWRGGCAELFEHIERELAGGEISVSTLAKSYRSSQVVLDAVNQVFANLSGNPALAEDVDVARAWDGRYETHVAAKDLPGYVCLETTGGDAPDADGGGDGEHATDSAHERDVAQRIAEIHKADPDRSIAVLVQKNRVIPRLLYELYALDIHASGEGGAGIADAPAVAAVLSALMLADHPGDSAAVFHAAHSPIGEVLGLRSTGGAHVQPVALRIRRRLMDEGYPAVLADWTRRLAPMCDEGNLRRLEQLVELAEAFEPMATLRAGDFVRFVRSSRTEQASSANVRVMTVHSAKGLGFDAVVLPDLDGWMHLRRELLVDREHPAAPVRGVYASPRKELLAVMPALQPIAQQARQQDLNEELCTLYVAMTRARYGLYIMIRPKGQRARNLTHGSILRHALSERDDHPEDRQVLYEHGDRDWMVHGRRVAAAPEKHAAPIRIKPSAGAARRGWASVSPSSLERGGRVAVSDLLRVEAHGGQRYGSLIHDWFARVGFVDEPGGEPGDEQLIGGDEQAVATFRAMLQHPVIRAALQRSGATDLWRERDFAVRDGDRLVRGKFDRVVVHDGGATIIDFKTDHVEEGGLADLVETYRPQMAAYRSALAAMLGAPAERVRAKLLFVGAGEVVEV